MPIMGAGMILAMPILFPTFLAIRMWKEAMEGLADYWNEATVCLFFRFEEPPHNPLRDRKW